jgi:hypothetical protein
MQTLESIKDLSKHKKFLKAVIWSQNGLRILGVPMGFHDFVTHFLDEVLFQDMAYINDILVLGHT